MSHEFQTDTDDLAADLLRGGPAIAAFLQTIGWPEATVDTVYYFARSKKLPIGKFGNELITSKTKLTRYVRKLVA
jgi:hypothetical protein